MGESGITQIKEAGVANRPFPRPFPKELNIMTLLFALLFLLCSVLVAIGCGVSMWNCSREIEFTTETEAQWNARRRRA